MFGATHTLLASAKHLEANTCAFNIDNANILEQINLCIMLVVVKTSPIFSAQNSWTWHTEPPPIKDVQPPGTAESSLLRRNDRYSGLISRKLNVEDMTSNKSTFIERPVHKLVILIHDYFWQTSWIFSTSSQTGFPSNKDPDLAEFQIFTRSLVRQSLSAKQVSVVICLISYSYGTIPAGPLCYMERKHLILKHY